MWDVSFFSSQTEQITLVRKIIIYCILSRYIQNKQAHKFVDTQQRIK